MKDIRDSRLWSMGIGIVLGLLAIALMTKWSH
jgi:hypothetical protein